MSCLARRSAVRVEKKEKPAHRASERVFADDRDFGFGTRHAQNLAFLTLARHRGKCIILRMVRIRKAGYPRVCSLCLRALAGILFLMAGEFTAGVDDWAFQRVPLYAQVDRERI